VSGWHARLDAARERYLAPRRDLADRLLARWKATRAAKRFEAADRLLRRARAVGIEFHFARSGVFWGFGTVTFKRFARRWSLIGGENR
jgi:hypothetical protein